MRWRLLSSSLPVLAANSINMSEIADFFAGKSVFLTGVSGFLGKVITEKLLRSCPHLKHIYVLVRTKKGVPGDERLRSILAEKVFDQLRSSNPDCLSKVRLVSGDLLMSGIGLRQDDLDQLQETIEVVIHSAASVRFAEPLRSSVEMNLRATLKMLEFATALKRLKAFVHVSTAYSNCNFPEVEERIYPCNVSPRQVMALCDSMSDDLLNYLSTKLVGDHPNTYTYTKALAENLVQEYADRLPIAIVRPSIITGAVSEPLPGWVESYNGPSGLLIALGTGVLTTLYAYLERVADLIPVDFVASLIIAACVRTAPQSVHVYNCTSGASNSIRWRDFMTYSIDYPKLYPSTSIVRYPQPHITSTRAVHHARLFFQHYVPALIIDVVLRCTGRKPALAALYKRVASSMDLLEYFTTHEWRFEDSNTRSLLASFNDVDRTTFNFDVTTIDWASYVHNYCSGIRLFILGEPVDNIVHAKRRLARLKYVSYITNLLLALGIWRVLCAVVPCSDMTGLC